jgi:hypothetical protein
VDYSIHERILRGLEPEDILAGLVYAHRLIEHEQVKPFIKDSTQPENRDAKFQLNNSYWCRWYITLRFTGHRNQYGFKSNGEV